MGLIDPDRFRESFERYSSIGATDREGLHRLALSEADGRVRDEFVADLEELGLSVRVDELGNVFGRRPGTEDLAPVLIGSHLDSQPKGGRYDGQLGVLSALETLRTFEDEGVETERPIEIVNWTNEEGSRFKPALTGSGAYVGAHDVETVLAETDENGTTVEEALEEIGYRGTEPVGPDEVPDSALELHVEQGPALEEADRRIGVVEGVLGMVWLEATVRGDADHAGPSPMHTRSDALVAAADVVTAVRRMAGRLDDDVVTTVGELTVEPNSVNVIPAEATFTVDVRSYDDEVVAGAVDRVEEELRAACGREGTEFELSELWRIPRTEFAPRVADAVEAAAAGSDSPAMRMTSGAGHDASYLAELTDAGMIFVPSVDGRTHNEREFTEWEDAVAGAEVFARTTRRLAGTGDGEGGRR
ncbi:Zn-dependent hydrolase [Halorarum salinum]|uniref:Zn-dependent hydrolase n=1 Tax=Halorarum salinum TaxID=2743089 RepID=A0A7D5LCD5_9EURY|nr:Zn-dependent hydrolase [Halobaculum salinum]QLG63412.1 Zn-dependent hydrolase [Halobaculum salinum]